MPTQVLAGRVALIRRALASVLGQQGVRVVPIVVINGPNGDRELMGALHADRRLQVATLEQADLPAALRVGRTLVGTPFFGELDDDDVLLPGALAVRVRALVEHPECHVVVTNGFRRDAARDTLHIPDIASVERDPLRALLRLNWLLPGSWLCRTDAVGPSVFDGMPKFRECTYLALRLATSYRIRFLDRPTVVWHIDSPSAASKSRDYTLASVAALQRFLELDLPPDVRAALRSRVAAAYHAVAGLHLGEGTLKDAWNWHLRSIGKPGGWRYLHYTLRLVIASCRI